MTFRFSLYAVPLQITQIAYFRSETENLESKESLEDSKVYCVLLLTLDLVDFQDDYHSVNY